MSNDASTPEPTGTPDAGAPVLVPFVLGSGEFDVDDVDGGLFMLDHALGGCGAQVFSRPMDLDAPGTVTVDGEPVDAVLRNNPLVPGATLLGIRLFGVLTDHGVDHAVHVEGFRSADGVTMVPADITVRTRERGLADPAYAEHEALAQRVAEEGAVLLTNDGTLPLRGGVLNVLGKGLHYWRTAVVGAGKINSRRTVALRDAIRESGAFELNEELAEHSRRHGDALPDAALLERARERADLGVVVLTRAGGENMDNSTDTGEYHLTEAEDTLIEASRRTFSRTVVLLNTPYPVDVSWARRAGVSAVLLAGVGGMLAGPAVVRILSGEVSPSGRLTDSWPVAIEDVPAHANFYDCAGGLPRYAGDDTAWIDTVYEEGLYVGYRFHETFGVPAAFPFGHGLSYTSFEQTSGRPVLADDGSLSLEVTVTNRGECPGREVVQLYVRKPEALGETPALELAAFAKTHELAPGEAVALTLTVPAADLAVWDEAASAWTVPAGEIEVLLGASSADTRVVGAVVVDQSRVVRRGSALMTPPEPVNVLSTADPEGTWPTGRRSGVKAGITSFEPPRAAAPAAPRPDVTARPGTIEDVIAHRVEAVELAASLSPETQARLVVCYKNGWGMEDTGVAGIAARPDGLETPLFQVADGNSGVNVRKPNIGFPTTVVLASTWDQELARVVGRAIGEEAAEHDVDVLLAPAMNLHRHPLCGRQPEYFSEDPLLAGLMAGSYAAGVEHAGVGACYKHFIANNAESSRKRNQSLVAPRALRELYLRAFEVALRVHEPATIMTAYNAVNGRHTAGDTELITGFLRGELGFTGAVMTDWTSYQTCDVVDMVRAGTDWITPGSEDEEFTAPLVAAVADGRLNPGLLRDSAARVIEMIARAARARRSRA